MIVIAAHPSTIYVRMIENGWLESKFDSTYPLELRGTISESEYQESINKINRSMQVSKALKIIWIILMLTGIGLIISIIALFRIKSKRMERLKEAIAEESAKYSSRSPISCCWRLDFTQHFFPGRTNLTVFRVAIDMISNDAPENGNVMDSSNQVILESAAFSTEQNNSAPPPDSVQSAGFSPQCGTARQDVTAKCCSSCEHSFDKY